MVMDAAPSPQTVGREFVRQYYTLLNKAPNHLHRFYTHQSSFVHGDLEPPAHSRDNGGSMSIPVVVGQIQIHNKIQQLGFRDCHAKISQLDAQTTLGNGIVVQVTGELSNDGQPMRRFTQTFVLAFQEPKKYYVHNDIFRYQDVVWQEDDHSQAGDEVTSTGMVEESGDIRRADVTSDNCGHNQDGSISAAVATNNMINEVGSAVTNQAIYNNNSIGVSGSQLSKNGPSVQQMTTPLVAHTGTGPVQSKVNTEHHTPHAPTVDNSMQTTAVAEEQQLQVQQVEKEKQQQDLLVEEKPSSAASVAPTSTANSANVSSELKTYANLFKSGGATSTAHPYANKANYNNSTLVSGNGSGAGVTNEPLPRGRGGDLSSQPQQRQNPVIRERRSSTNNNIGSGGGYGDNQQLFVGNIPHHATEEDLKAMFSKYGPVVDLRIFTKQGQVLQQPGKMGSGRVPQNYGFITFRDPESVQAVLANQHICFPEDSPDGQKLNIEEKMNKARINNESGDRRPMGGNGHPMGNGDRRPGMSGRNGISSGGGAGIMRGSGGGPRGANNNGSGVRVGGSFNRGQIIRNGGGSGAPLSANQGSGANNNNSYGRR